jgi:hypothetical protein
LSFLGFVVLSGARLPEQLRMSAKVNKDHFAFGGLVDEEKIPADMTLPRSFPFSSKFVIPV